ncbi:4-oxalocrotonate tautomerase DmpI [Sporomusa termitida]|uniref:Taut: 4-oxalocrotonate tautomerase family enzyme n=1 Tax=Sporomusa termitida TaxID=2377 RepID=A0A517DPQ7_9FIRM|nr:4-oxalocrotonate tautomerase DmpI [Sporomusa termitida]QDR79344.1 taut: 4-oxalocrotonate tautomerase family enzyme [Sporomusa termitida]
MPVITIETGKLEKEQKVLLVERFTKTASEILKIPEQSFIVQLKENESDNIGVGGKLLTQVIAERNSK